MDKDPFGNLRDWGQVLDQMDFLAQENRLSDCQFGLIRILRYKGNWRLREEALKCVAQIQTPCEALFFQVLDILADDNLYYDARILASDALVRLLRCAENGCSHEIGQELCKITEKLKSSPQPPFFDKALTRLYAEVGAFAVAPLPVQGV